MVLAWAWARHMLLSWPVLNVPERSLRLGAKTRKLRRSMCGCSRSLPDLAGLYYHRELEEPEKMRLSSWQCYQASANRRESR